jgi:hypothetical protein
LVDVFVTSPKFLHTLSIIIVNFELLNCAEFI